MQFVCYNHRKRGFTAYYYKERIMKLGLKRLLFLIPFIAFAIVLLVLSYR